MPFSNVAKVPVVMQLEALECGAASLAMVMAHYGKWVPLSQAREDCGVSRDGSNARNILKAARSYGMEAHGYRYEPEDLLNSGSFPCIVHWEFNHFIVLDGVRGDKVYVNDPARGNLTMSRKEFDEGFTGVVLTITPGPDFVPSGKKKSVLGFAKKSLRGTGPAIFFVVLTTIVTSLITIIEAGFSRIFMDQLLTRRDLHIMLPFIVALGGFSLIQVVAAWIQAIYSLRITGKMAVIGNATYLWKVLRLPMKFFSQRMAGDIQQRKDTNAGIANSLINTIAPLFLDSLMMIFYLTVMIRYSVPLTLVGITSVLVNLVVSRVISKKRVNVTRVQMRDEGKLVSSTVTGVEMIETIKSSGAEDGYFRRWAGFQASVNTQVVRYARMDAYLGLIPSIVQVAANLSVQIMGVYLVMHGDFTNGMVLQFQGFMSQFLAPAASLISASQTVTEMRTQMERLEDVMEYPAALDGKELLSEDDSGYQKLSGTLSMQHVTFGYSKLAEPLIKDFNLEIKRGGRVAFVGASGCGKSTLSKLISGLYEPWEGKILFDGKEIKDIRRSVFTGSVAVVDQDITLFEDSIANNIKMWDHSVEDYEMILAARDAQIHEDIMQRDGGYSYQIMENGKDFSGGQRQRMEIARVLAQDPTIVIMDEATSALDAQTEYDVVKAIEDRGITCIVVAHRLSTIRDCDEIIVMDRGNVVERGTHEELMANDGLYKELITSE
ncbi:MAG: NHLP family bacteriocin export ABC transporter peptidase/permease/ATPase subunit [Lachnospiraceae bacterium]|nr:NHLP family bacteriocin export ABC transporter peptidase/permease/ATPase subunit [Lachnospiraceae bacterium]